MPKGTPLFGDRSARDMGYADYHASDIEDSTFTHHLNGGRIRHSIADVSNPPTQLELNAIFGTAASAGAGFTAVLDDNGSNTNVYIIVSNGIGWWYIALTQMMLAANVSDTLTIDETINVNIT